MERINFSHPLSSLGIISPRYTKLMERMGLRTIEDLVYHFPVRYEDFSVISPINDVDAGQQVTVSGIIERVDLKQTWKRHLAITEAIITDETGSIKAVWFNQPYIKNSLRVGRRVNFSGKVSINEKEIYLSHPTFELSGHSENSEENTIHTGRLVPVYPETRGLTSKGIRSFIHIALEHLETPPEWIPESILEKNNFPHLAEALRAVHFPESLEEALIAKRRFAFEDLFLLQLYNFAEREKLSATRAPIVKGDKKKISHLIAKLPFTLTESQRASLEEILADMELGKPMNRLLQGDVGSGKTIVAVIAAAVAADAGYQAAFLAPTEILARQHFESVKKVLSALENPPVVGFIASQTALIHFEEGLEKAVSKKELTQKIASGAIAILIGTHAVIQKSIAFKKLGLLVIDEQHRFGVKQRAELLKRKVEREEVPHFLSMSATPIPRTLMLTLFGDLDLSLINELPAGRKPIITKVVAPENRIKAYGLIKGQIAKGRQVFVVCPRIEKTEENSATKKKGTSVFSMLEVKTVKEEYEKLAKKIFPESRVAMLHGKLKAPEKERAMREFKEGKVDILVATSVIEVGVDIPNASIMMIEGAERFGLAQLYQFKGRVGRGAHQSFCFLFTDSPYKTTVERLQSVADAKSGFELAEVDLKLRGPGEFLGSKQTGLPDIAMRGLQDSALIKASRESAEVVYGKPKEKGSEALREKLSEFSRKLHQE